MAVEQARERAVQQQIRDLVPVADWMQALRGDVVAIVAGLAGAHCPVNQGSAGVVTDFLFAFLELLLASVRPGEAQITRGWHQTQADRAPFGEKHRITEPVVLLALEQARDWQVSQMAGRDHVRQGTSELSTAAPRLRQMHLQERSKAILQLGERVDRLDGTGALSPARASARRQRDHEHLTAFERGAARALVGGVEGLTLHDVTRTNVFDWRICRESVLGEADAFSAQISADSFMLLGVEAVSIEQLGQGVLGVRPPCSGQQATEQ